MQFDIIIFKIIVRILDVYSIDIDFKFPFSSILDM